LLEQAMEDWKTCYARLQIPVSVNLSPRNLQGPELPYRIQDLLQRHQIPPSMLHLEITESFVMADPSGAAQYLTRLHDMGTVLAIDDFGTGYSSLSYLRQLPVDVLKIDQSLVIELADGDDAIVKCAIDLGHNLGLTVVAEGVESAYIRDRLKHLDCDVAQGFFIAKPNPPQDTRDWIDKQRRPKSIGTAADISKSNRRFG
jgi:EAL domain-containing protein (putative c-di-GMP-specific phosphodiesterase class I)